ncbi:MAG: FAD-dependent oxidoreductase [Burkholderiaceae bacterium]|jgi:3-(3-hydroxy-phenyl)propionate hydroxylase|nr:MAG: FAD-dependent oxidoreductase [Burkholderiaceae bacterium]
MSFEFAPYPFTATRHPARLPLLTQGAEPGRHPVVVIGAGPVGFCSAIGLARHGVPVVLLEADDSVCFGSRAICISRRSLEIAERLGALSGFLKIGLPWTGGRSYYRDAEVLHFEMPSDENQKLPPMINLAQYSIEQILLDRAEQLAQAIDIRWQTRLSGITVRADGVELAVATPAGDYRIDADWVIAADGGRSFVRDALGLQLEGTSYEGRYVIVDILLDSARPTERLAYFDPPCNRGSTVLVHKQPGNVWRIDYQLQDGEDPDAAIRPENVLPRVTSLLDMMGEKGDWKPIWIGIYKANALTLPSYRHGRVLFAGDAAHLVPIFGVRGANSGIDDADNLAWKLAFVIKGLASDSLLASYSVERVAATHENLSYGTKSTEFMAPPSFAFELMRTAVLGLAGRHPSLSSLINPRQTSAITYEKSPLNVAGDDAAFTAGPQPGAVLAECPITITVDGVQREGYLTDLLSLPPAPSFVALVFGDGGASDALHDLRQQLASRKVPFKTLSIAPKAGSGGATARDSTGRLFGLYGAAPGTVYLVRPDGHVLGRWRTPRLAELLAAIDRALGH